MEELTEQEKANKFVKEYTELCEKYSLQLTPVPEWVSTNHGTFELVTKLTVVNLVK